MESDEAYALVDELVRRQNERDEGWIQVLTDLITAQTKAIMAAIGRR